MIILTPADYADRVAIRKRNELLAEIEALEHVRPEAEALLAPFMADVEAGRYDCGQDAHSTWGRNGYRIRCEINNAEVVKMTRLLLVLAGWSVDTDKWGLLVARPGAVTSAKLSDC